MPGAADLKQWSLTGREWNSEPKVLSLNFCLFLLTSSVILVKYLRVENNLFNFS